jgi:hypothetical protein
MHIHSWNIFIFNPLSDPQSRPRFMLESCAWLRSERGSLGRLRKLLVLGKRHIPTLQLIIGYFWVRECSPSELYQYRLHGELPPPLR